MSKATLCFNFNNGAPRHVLREKRAFGRTLLDILSPRQVRKVERLPCRVKVDGEVLPVSGVECVDGVSVEVMD